MSRVVTLIDYGVGNLFSVRRAFETMGADVRLTQDPAEILAAERLILPGVGAFEDGMRGLRQYGLIEPIRAYAKTGKPFLGICLGMQMMLESSEEFGQHEGLGLIRGQVKRIPDKSESGEAMKVPHVGWDGLKIPPARGQGWDGTIFQGLSEESSVYFVHSYSVVPSDPQDALGIVHYGGMPVVAAVASGNLYGCQFHPERSGPIGLRIVQNFIAK